MLTCADEDVHCLGTLLAQKRTKSGLCENELKKGHCTQKVLRLVLRAGEVICLTRMRNLHSESWTVRNNLVDSSVPLRVKKGLQGTYRTWGEDVF
jgi:hypothetical protein